MQFCLKESLTERNKVIQSQCSYSEGEKEFEYFDSDDDIGDGGGE